MIKITKYIILVIQFLVNLLKKLKKLVAFTVSIPIVKRSTKMTAIGFKDIRIIETKF